jgi:hypothetical protein
MVAIDFKKTLITASKRKAILNWVFDIVKVVVTFRIGKLSNSGWVYSYRKRS